MTAADHAPDLIIIGATARAACASAKQAGYHPWCADLFTDVDLQAMAPTVRCPPGTYPDGFDELIQRVLLPATVPVLLTGAMENHLEAVRRIITQRPLLGPDLATITAWRALPSQPALQPEIPGLSWCPTRVVHTKAQRMALRLGSLAGQGRWINKPSNSGGGIGVDVLRPWSKLDDTRVIQERVQGEPLGVLWRADHSQSQLLGVTRQLISNRDFCPKGRYRYTGSLGPVTLTAPQTTTLMQLGQWLVDDAALHTQNQLSWQGLFGADVILDAHGQLWPIEFNPRYTASVEVLETALQFAALNPNSQPNTAPTCSNPCAGKAYVFARHASVLPDLTTLFEPGQIADIPHPGTAVKRGQPICSLLTLGRDADTCLLQLQEMAHRLYTRLRE